MDRPNKLLVNVDSQIDFVMPWGALPVQGATKIIEPGIRFLANLDPTVYFASLWTFDTHTPTKYIGSPENLGDPKANQPGFPIHCDKNTPGWANVFNPLIMPEDIPLHILEKDVFNMWADPMAETIMFPPLNGVGPEPFAQFLANLQDNDVDTVTMMGVAADFCVKDAITGFLARGFKVEVVEHLTAGIIRDMKTTIDEEWPGRVTLI